MKRRTLDILFSIGGLGITLLLLVAGLVLASNVSFAKNYVGDQLGAQRITFKTAETLTPEEKQSSCLVKYAGQPLTTGKQAECYANDFIGLHVKTSTKGLTYAELGTPERAAKTALADAVKVNPNDPAIPELQKKAAEITATRDTAFKGETLKGLLLTSYGFSELGTKGGQVLTVVWIAAALMALLSLLGLVHAFRTPKTAAFAPPEPVRTKIRV